MSTRGKRKATEEAGAASPKKKAAAARHDSAAAEHEAAGGMPEAPGCVSSLMFERCEEALEFYGRAFLAETLSIHKGPDGGVMHASFKINGTPIYAGEYSGEKFTQPPALKGKQFPRMTLHLNLEVGQADVWFNRAVDAGCTVVMPIEDTFWGARYGLVRDPYGHVWAVMHNLPGGHGSAEKK
eukprot:c39097_g1_i1.p2 GENE.c39097_g1_i1~~c39097_g1_i1.p2  ORF type:complete len:195 (-),score=42.95 c39097_g1_i1:14-562(-)